MSDAEGPQTSDGVTVCYVLCRVEGCPRTVHEGQEEACGLGRLGVPLFPESPHCGVTLTLNRWDADDPNWLEPREDGPDE